MSTNKKFALITLFLGLTVCAYIFSLWWWRIHAEAAKAEQQFLENRNTAVQLYHQFSLLAEAIRKAQGEIAHDPKFKDDPELMKAYEFMLHVYNSQMEQWHPFLEEYLVPSDLEKMPSHF